MPDKNSDTIIAAVMAQLVAECLQAMARAMTALMNLAMRIKREQFLGAGHYERAVVAAGHRRDGSATSLVTSRR